MLIAEREEVSRLDKHFPTQLISGREVVRFDIWFFEATEKVMSGSVPLVFMSANNA